MNQRNETIADLQKAREVAWAAFAEVKAIAKAARQVLATAMAAVRVAESAVGRNRELES